MCYFYGIWHLSANPNLTVELSMLDYLPVLLFSLFLFTQNSKVFKRINYSRFISSAYNIVRMLKANKYCFKTLCFTRTICFWFWNLMLFIRQLMCSLVQAHVRKVSDLKETDSTMNKTVNLPDLLIRLGVRTISIWQVCALGRS